MIIKKIYIGGWFQRTTLHLTETWDFFKYGKSELDFEKKELAEHLSILKIKEVSRENGPFEYLLVSTSVGIIFRIYEDGLIVLEREYTDLKKDFVAIKDYYDNRLSKALSFIFSKGAPVPKELANIKTILPYIVTVEDATEEDATALIADFKEEIYSRLSTKAVEVYRSKEIILINNLKDEDLAREVIESQIFFREFKSQLHRYLAIHRILWEKIDHIKEVATVRGTEIDGLKNELSAYQKTITLIGTRIDQMSAYAKTRQKMTDAKKIDEFLNPLFQYKFETLLDTHEYIKNLWVMTKNYLSSAMDIFTDLQAKSTKNTISSLQLVTTIGVVAGIFGYLSKDSWPTFTIVGLGYFLGLLLLTWLINSSVSHLYKHKKYVISDQAIRTDIK